MNRHFYQFATVLFAAVTLGCGENEPIQNGAPNIEVNETTAVKTGGQATTSTPPRNSREYYQFESAKIEFVYTGDFEGKETFYIEDWGNTVVMVENKTEFGNAVSKTIIWKDDQTTIYDHLAKTVWQGKMRVQATEPPAIGWLKESQLPTVGYEKLSNETIGGKDCKVYDNKQLKVKYWVWNGMDLKIINYALGKTGYTREATSVEENITVPQDVLATPEGYTKS